MVTLHASAFGVVGCTPQALHDAPVDAAVTASDASQDHFESERNDHGTLDSSVAIAPDAPFEAGSPPSTVGEGGPDAAGAPSSDSKRAEDCLARPTCPAADAARFFAAASDSNDPDLDCLRFADGAGTPRDLTRARACLEHQAKALACDGSSMFLETATLVSMRIDGVGGRPDGPGARALLGGCFDDATREALLEHAAAKDRDPKTPPVDFCKDIGGTTITVNECGARASKNAATARDLGAKAVVAGLDDEGKELFAASDTAYGDYVSAMGAFVYEVYVEGTIRGALSAATETKLTAVRVKDLEEFPRFVAKAPSANDVAAAQRASAAALARVSTNTAAERAALEKTQRTWETYRDADVALYEHVFGSKQGSDQVAAALRVRLALRRAKECAPPSASGP